MVSIFGNDIISAYTGGISVIAIFNNGVLVWPSIPITPTYYFIKWTPEGIQSGSFSMFGRYYSYKNYNGYYSWLSSGWLGANAFAGNLGGSYIKTVSTNVSQIYNNCFGGCSKMTSANLSYCRYIGSDAFYDCTSLTSVSMPYCSYIGFAAFMYDEKLTSINAPYLMYLSDLAFKNCTRLSMVNMPLCSYVGGQAFYRCNLSTIYLPHCEYIDYRAFALNNNLSEVSLPVCKHIDEEAFFGNPFSVLDLPSCEVLANNVCEGCQKLTTVNLPVCSSLGSNCFYYCEKLRSVTLGSSSVCYIGSSAFYDTSIADGRGYIYVPSSLLSSYKRSYYSLSSVFRPIQ